MDLLPAIVTHSASPRNFLIHVIRLKLQFVSDNVFLPHVVVLVLVGFFVCLFVCLFVVCVGERCGSEGSRLEVWMKSHESRVAIT